MKKDISLLVSLCLIFSLTSTACASSDKSHIYNQANQIDYLINAGLPQTYLERRTPNEINTLFELAQTHTLQHFSMSTSYFEDDTSPFGTIPVSDMAFNVDGIAAIKPSLSNEPSYLTSVFVTIDYQWNSGHPFIRAEDAITVNWDSSLFQFTEGTFYSEDYHHMGSGEVPVNSQTRPATLNLGGLGYYAQLTNTSPNPVLYRGNAGFILQAKENMYSEDEYPSNVKRSLITAVYTHNKNPLGIGLSFLCKDFSVSVSSGSIQDSAGDSFSITYSMPK